MGMVRGQVRYRGGEDKEEGGVGEEQLVLRWEVTP